jgi:HPt (histidine-containing phosphotransfer) domain-containing protein
MESDRKRCLAAGMDGYLSKPIDTEALFAEVEQHHYSPAPAGPLGAAPVTFDRRALVARTAGDHDLMMEVITAFLEDGPSLLAKVQDAADRRDAEALRLAAHTLKGAASSLGADALAEIAGILERLGAESRLDAAVAAARAMSAEAAKLLGVLRETQTLGHMEVA